MSDFESDADVNVRRRFYQELEKPGVGDAAVEEFGLEGCGEIRIRCRFLRSMPVPISHKLIGAMSRALQEVVDRAAPDAAMAVCVDYYAADILERILSARGVRLAGISAAPLVGQTLLSTRGEHNAIREPTAAEIEQALSTFTDARFTAFLPKRQRYDLTRFLRNYAYYTGRAAAFKMIETWTRDTLNLHYWLRRPTLGYRVRLRDWAVVRHFQHDWGERLARTPLRRRVFIALGVYPESTIDYWVRDQSLLAYDDVLEAVVTSFSEAGYVPVIKDHPNMFSFQRVDLIARLARVPGAVMVPYDVDSPRLIRETGCTFTFAGTAGLQAALAGRCAIVTDPYYFVDGPFIRLPNREEIADLPASVAAFRPPQDLDSANRRLVRQVLRTCLPGDLLGSWKGFAAGSTSAGERHLVQSMNQLLPTYFGAMPEGIDSGALPSTSP